MNTINAIEDLNLSIEEGEFICFVGPTGCGKTTLLNILAGFNMSIEGQVFLNGQLVNKTGLIELWYSRRIISLA